MEEIPGDLPEELADRSMTPKHLVTLVVCWIFKEDCDRPEFIHVHLKIGIEGALSSVFVTEHRSSQFHESIREAFQALPPGAGIEARMEGDEKNGIYWLKAPILREEE